MNKKIPLIFVSLMLVLAPVACTFTFPGGQVQGSGEIIRQERSVDFFDRVALQGIGEVLITTGGAQSVLVQTDDNLMEYIETRIEDDILVLSFKDNAPRSLSPSQTVRYEITASQLEGVNLSGAGTIEVDSSQAKDFEVTVSGSGDVRLGTVDAERLDLLLSGAGNIELEKAKTQVTNIENTGAGMVHFGTVTADLLAVLISGAGGCQIDGGEVARQKVEISGKGSFDAPDLKSNRSDLQISGAGGAAIWVVEILDVVISGAGDVHYYGSPEVTVEASGAGEVQGLGAK